MKNFAEEIIKKYNTRDPFEIAHKMGILIISEPLGEIESYFSPTLIHINSDLPEWYQPFVIARHLYNALNLHDGLAFAFRNRYDYSREAIRFAVQLHTDFEKIERFGFEEAARFRGIPEDQIPILKERFYKILECDSNGES